MYEAGENLIYSPLNEFQRNYQTWGGRHRSLIGKDLETGLKERQKDFLVLYEDIKKNGYSPDSPPLFVWFDNDGFIRLYDGHHRMAIVHYLGIDPDIWVETNWKSIDVENTVGRDFPLVETLIEKHKGRRLYHYITDPRVKDFWINRKDGPPRLNYLLKKLVGKSVLDIGCSEGYFCHELAKQGYEPTGIEIDRKLIAITRYLAIIQNVKIDCRLMDWKDLLRENNVYFDNILYLSVLHNEVNHIGEEKAFQNLKIFRGRTKRLFIEVPNINVQKDWSHIFKLSEVCPRLERETRMKVKEVWEGYRPIILLVNQLEKGQKLLKLKEVINMETLNVENVNGCKMSLIKDDFPITASIKETEKWEPRTTEFIKNNLKKGQTFVDVGASVGYYTLLASKLVGPKGKVISFEPFEENYNVLMENIKLNKLKNVSAFQTALSFSSGKGKLFKANVPGQYSLIQKEDSNEYLIVKTEPFNKLTKEIPDMIKIDVEGGERSVLDGMENVLKTKKELTIILEDYSGEVVEWLGKTYGFKVITTEREYGNYMLVKNQKRVKAKPEPMRFHLVGTFNTPTNKKEGIGYAFCSKIINVAKALKSLGHEIIFYGAEGSEVECDEFVEVLNKRELPQPLYLEDKNHPSNLTFNKRIIQKITEKKSPYVNSRDFLLIPTGNYQKLVADLTLIPLTVEVGIGYSGIFANHKIFESYTWLHYLAGEIKQKEGVFTNAVIPPIFDPKDFEYSEKKDDYFLFLGRINHDKGIRIAVDTVKAIGAKLKVAGIESGVKIEESPDIKKVGFANWKKRKELLSKAKAVFVPTLYFEPFGYVIIEAAMSGTPVITTDWGAFTENVIHGKTGFRCKTLEQFIWAAKNIDKIKPADCRKWAMENFTLKKIAPMYQEYFEQLQNLYGKGWYSKNPDRKDLDFLKKVYG